MDAGEELALLPEPALLGSPCFRVFRRHASTAGDEALDEVDRHAGEPLRIVRGAELRDHLLRAELESDGADARRERPRKIPMRAVLGPRGEHAPGPLLVLGMP